MNYRILLMTHFTFLSCWVRAQVDEAERTLAHWRFEKLEQEDSWFYVNDLYLIFKGKEPHESFRLNWWKFDSK